MLSRWLAVRVLRVKPTNLHSLISQYALIGSGALVRHRGCGRAWIADAASNGAADPRFGIAVENRSILIAVGDLVSGSYRE